MSLLLYEAGGTPGGVSRDVAETSGRVLSTLDSNTLPPRSGRECKQTHEDGELRVACGFQASPAGCEKNLHTGSLFVLFMVGKRSQAFRGYRRAKDGSLTGCRASFCTE